MLAYVVVGKDQVLLDAVRPAVPFFEPLPIPLEGLSEDRPLRPAHKPPLLPRVVSREVRCAVAHPDLLVAPRNNLFAPVNPFVPIPPHKRPVLPLLRQQVDPVVQLAHSLGDLLARLRIAQLLGRQGARVEELLEAAVPKGAEQARADALAGQAPQDLELRFAVDEVLDLGAVDAEEEFAGVVLAWYGWGLGCIRTGLTVGASWECVNASCRRWLSLALEDLSGGRLRRRRLSGRR